MPDSSPDTIRVLAAVVLRYGRYLVCRRPAHKRHGGLWEFPGGKLEPGETLLHAARRELAEELGVTTISVEEPVFEVHDTGSPFVIEFVPTEVEGTPQCLEHSELAWARVEDLTTMELAPSDRRFVEWMVAGESSAR